MYGFPICRSKRHTTSDHRNAGPLKTSTTATSNRCRRFHEVRNISRSRAGRYSRLEVVRIGHPADANRSAKSSQTPLVPSEGNRKLLTMRTPCFSTMRDTGLLSAYALLSSIQSFVSIILRCVRLPKTRFLLQNTLIYIADLLNDCIRAESRPHSFAKLSSETAPVSTEREQR